MQRKNSVISKEKHRDFDKKIKIEHFDKDFFK